MFEKSKSYHCSGTEKRKKENINNFDLKLQWFTGHLKNNFILRKNIFLNTYNNEEYKI